MSDRPLVRLTEVKANQEVFKLQFKRAFDEHEAILLAHELQVIENLGYMADTKDILLRLKNHLLQECGFAISYSALERQLSAISLAFEAAVSAGIEVDSNLLTKQFAVKKRGRPKKQGRGIPKPIVSPYDNKPYKSIADAARAAKKKHPKANYSTMASQVWREEKSRKQLKAPKGTDKIELINYDNAI